jgi:hypothetical protein
MLKRLAAANARLRSRWMDLRHGMTVPELQAAIAAGLGLPPELQHLPGTGFPADALRNAAALSRAVGGLVTNPAAQEHLWDLQVGRSEGGLGDGPLVVALGTHCFTAALLKRWGWRREAGPFDWLFSTIPMVTHIIEDDFARFLDPSEYQPVPVEQRRAGPDANRVHHAFYRQHFGVEHVFNHHDVHLPEVYQHFVRAVDRFRATLAEDRPKLFIAFHWHYGGFEQEAQLLHAALAARTRRFALHVIAVAEPRPEAWLPQMHAVSAAAGAGTWLFNPVSRWQPLAFPSKLDELCLNHAIQQMRRDL